MNISVAKALVVALSALSLCLSVLAVPAGAQDAEPAPEPAAEPAAEPAPAPAPEPAPAPAEPPAPVDPLANESVEPTIDENGEPVEPELDEDGQPKKTGRYANQPDFVEDFVNQKMLASARKRLAAKITEREEAVNQVRSLRIREKALRTELLELGNETRETILALEIAERRLRDRALNAFQSGDNQSVAALRHDDLLEARVQQFLVTEVFKVDQASIQNINRLKAQLDSTTLDAYERYNRVGETRARLDTVVEGLGVDQHRLEVEVETWLAKSEFYVPDLVFPIDGPYEMPLINSWGYDRAPGTPDAHWHEGIDIFAPEGTPIVASEAGITFKVGIAKLGGIRVWVLGESGTEYYYSHMASIVEGLENGQRVELGQVLGYVGHSGNAMGTPDHLHMQIHPNGGRPANPYPALKVASDREQVQIAELVAEAEAAAIGDVEIPRGIGPGGFSIITGR